MRTALILLALVIAAPVLALDYLGTSAQFEWTQPDDFEGTEWLVYVSRNGGALVLEQTVDEKRATIAGEIDETLAVTVQASLGIHQSEPSEPSEPVTFRVLGKPGGVALYCEAGLVEVAPGWWSCP